LHKRTFIYRTASEQECDGTYLKQHYFAGRAFRWSLRNAAKTVVQNEIDKENIQRIIGVYSTVLPNAHRLPVLREVKRDTILWVGRSAQLKRPELFMQLAEKIPDESFTMICQWATGDKKYEELLARASRVKNLRFIKQVPFCKIDIYYRRAKVFVSTSESEGFPNTFIEACNYAVPILSLKVDPDGFINRYNCGITCDGDWKRLVDSLKIMLQEQRYLELGRNARKYVEEHHDLAEIVKQYKHLFIELLRSLR
jgi:glycosyltransferase involved in cell wall biosynthesis